MNAENKLLSAMTGILQQFAEVEQAALFGSRARGDNGDRSDYDVAVYGALSGHARAELRAAFEETLPTLHKVDIVFMQDISDPKFILNVEKEGIVFYVKDRK